MNTQKFDFGLTPLIRASSNGHLEIVRLLASYPKVDLNAEDSEMETALLCAVRMERVEIAKFLSLFGKINVNARGNYGTALSIACEFGSTEIVKHLTSLPHYRIRINDSAHEGKTPLLLASQHGYLEIVQHLVSLPDIDIDRKDNNGASALSLAKANGQSKVVRYLEELSSQRRR